MTLIGLTEGGYGEGPAKITQLLDRVRPGRVVLRTPIREVLSWAARAGVPVLPLFADSFDVTGLGPRALRARLRARRLAGQLNGAGIDTVSNHNVAACAGLVRIGVDKDKVIPWDWPAARKPFEFAAKALGGAPYTLLYVGEVSAAKGVGDLTAAMGETWMDEHCHLQVVGKGEERAAIEAGVPGGARIEFLGLRPNAEVFDRMRAADLVVVPSRHAYSEGLPGTIYEALTARTPLVASDHPMFEATLAEGEGVVFTPEADPAGLAATIQRVLTDAAGYARLSETTLAAFERIRCPNLFHEVVEAWLHGDPEGWLAARRGAWRMPGV